MKRYLIQELSQKLPEDLVKDLVESYEKVLIEYRKGKWDDTLLKAGKFVENVFRILHFLRTNEIIREVESIKEEVSALERMPKKNMEESIRIIIPRIASSITYTLRSKRNVAHVKSIDPTYIDATLSIVSCDWILAEFLRLFHISSEDKIVELMTKLMNRKIPFIEEHGDETFITKRLGCKYEILLLLLNNPDGITRKEIGKIIGKYYSQSTITEALQELENKREVVYSDTTKKYYLTGPGEKTLTNVLSEIV